MTVSQRYRISRPVILIAIITGIMWMGASTVLPFLPIIIHEKHASYTLLGLIIGAYYVGSIIAPFPIGRLSDRMGHRTIIIGALVVYLAANAAFLLPLPPQLYIAWRLLQGLSASSAEVASLAAIALLTPPERRGQAYSRVTAAVSIGIAIGPVIGALYTIAGASAVFITATCASAAALMLAIFGLRIPASLMHEDPATHDVDTVPHPDRVIRRVVLGAIAVNIGWGILIGNYDTNWTLLMQLRHAGAFAISMSWTLFAIPFGAFAWLGGWLADHRDQRTIILITACLGGLLSILYPYLGTYELLLFFAPIEAVTEVLMTPSLQSIVTGVVPRNRIGTLQGVLATATNIASAVGAVIAGILWSIGPKYPFAVAGGTLFVLTILARILWIPYRRLLTPGKPLPPFLQEGTFLTPSVPEE
ncbi:MAG: MFS transporter [Candidatus Dormibacteria bacterium]